MQAVPSFSDKLPAASAPAGLFRPAAAGQTAGQPRGLSAQSVPVSIVRARVDILYRVTDPVAFTYHYAEPEKVLQAIAERELTRYLASASLHQVLGGSRDAAARLLRTRINAAAAGQAPGEKAETPPSRNAETQSSVLPNPLGVEVFYVSFQDIHPPKDLAGDFESVISAHHEAQATIQQAASIANRTLAEAAGTRSPRTRSSP